MRISELIRETNINIVSRLINQLDLTTFQTNFNLGYSLKFVIQILNNDIKQDVLIFQNYYQLLTVL